MKKINRLTTIGVAISCCTSLSAVAAEQGAESSASAQIMSSYAWQQATSQFGVSGFDLNGILSGAGGGTEVISNEADFGTDTNFTTIPASAFDNSIVTSPGERINMTFLTPWPGNPTPPTADLFDVAPGQFLFCGNPAAVPLYDAPVHLPSGALITNMEFYGWDVDNTAQIQAGLINVCNTTPGTPPAAMPWPQFGTLNRLSVTPASGVAATPGVVRLNGSAVNHTVDNQNCAYSAVVITDCTNPLATAAFKVRIAWKRQISPGPAAATFSDVPTSHPFYDAIEAMAASGITGGCGGGRYCPDNNLTRGQMAAFLARGLGL